MQSEKANGMTSSVFVRSHTLQCLQLQKQIETLLQKNSFLPFRIQTVLKNYKIGHIVNMSWMLYSANPLGQLTLSITRLHTDVVKILSIFPSKTLRLDQIFIMVNPRLISFTRRSCVFGFFHQQEKLLLLPLFNSE